LGVDLQASAVSFNASAKAREFTTYMNYLKGGMDKAKARATGAEKDSSEERDDAFT
jgi:hypothetical protein